MSGGERSVSAAQAVPCPVPASAQKQRPHFPSCQFLSRADRLLDPRNGLGPPATAARAPQLHPRLVREPPPRPDGAPCVQLLLARSSPVPAWAQKHGEKGSGHEGQGCPPAGKRAEDPLLKPCSPGRHLAGSGRTAGAACAQTWPRSRRPAGQKSSSAGAAHSHPRRPASATLSALPPAAGFIP